MGVRSVKVPISPWCHVVAGHVFIATKWGEMGNLTSIELKGLVISLGNAMVYVDVGD